MILDIPICTCGEPMQPFRRRPDFFWCPDNCDGVQSQQVNAVGFDGDGFPVYGERVPTIRDQRVVKVWEGRVVEFYPDQTEADTKMIRDFLEKEGFSALL